LLLLIAVALSALGLAGCEPNPPRPKAAAAGEPARDKAAVLAERLGCALRETPDGPMIVAIDTNGPAATAGARAGDLVLGVNGTAVDDVATLASAIASSAPGDKLELELERWGELHYVAIAPAGTGARPLAEAEKGTGSAPGTAPAVWTALGIEVRDVPDTARRALGVDDGVMVVRVRPPASHTRLLPGDVIVEVNLARFRGTEEFSRLVSAQRGAVALLVRRADADLYITLEPGEAALGGAEDASRWGETEQDAARGGNLPPGLPWLRPPRTTGKPLRT